MDVGVSSGGSFLRLLLTWSSFGHHFLVGVDLHKFTYTVW